MGLVCQQPPGQQAVRGSQPVRFPIIICLTSDQRPDHSPEGGRER